MIGKHNEWLTKIIDKRMYPIAKLPFISDRLNKAKLSVITINHANQFKDTVNLVGVH